MQAQIGFVTIQLRKIDGKPENAQTRPRMADGGEKVTHPVTNTRAVEGVYARARVLVCVCVSAPTVRTSVVHV